MTIEELSEPFPSRPHEHRTGIHLKSVVDDLFKLLFAPKGEDGEIDDVALARMEMGFLFEDALSAAFGDRMAPRYDGMLCDGIWANPDGVRLEDGIIEEYKVTWAGSHTRPPDANWRWMAQVKGYCKVYGFRTVVFRVLYVCGDYAKPIRPQYKVFRCEFSELEVEQNWQMILNHARSKFGLGG
jgi:hypothetical protein